MNFNSQPSEFYEALSTETLKALVLDFYRNLPVAKIGTGQVSQVLKEVKVIDRIISQRRVDDLIRSSDELLARLNTR